jgi:preprotein translocase subunit SecB
MKSSDQDLVIQATSCLKLRDIVLFDCSFERPSPDTPDEDIAAEQQFMRHVTYLEGQATDGDVTTRVLQFRISLGTQVVESEPAKEDEPRIFLRIEASYIVEYEMAQDLAKEALSAFANFNAVHNVWPFWRQHVFDVVQRGKLPPLQVPLYPGVRSDD